MEQYGNDRRNMKLSYNGYCQNFQDLKFVVEIANHVYF